MNLYWELFLNVESLPADPVELLARVEANRVAQSRYGFTLEMLSAGSELELLRRINSVQRTLLHEPEAYGVMDDVTWKYLQAQASRWKREEGKLREIRWMDLEGTWRNGPDMLPTYTPFDQVKHPAPGQIPFVDISRLEPKQAKRARQDSKVLVVRQPSDLVFARSLDGPDLEAVFVSPKASHSMFKGDFASAEVFMLTSHPPAHRDIAHLARLGRRLGRRLQFCPVLDDKANNFEVERYRRKLDELPDITMEVWTLHPNPASVYLSPHHRATGSLVNWISWAQPCVVPMSETDLQNCHDARDVSRISRTSQRKRWTQERRRRFMESRAIRKSRPNTRPK